MVYRCCDIFYCVLLIYCSGARKGGIIAVGVICGLAGLALLVGFFIKACDRKLCKKSTPAKIESDENVDL